MAMDFKSFVNSGSTGVRTISSMQRRPLVDLTKSRPTTLWSDYTPSAANKSLKGALTTIKNAPVSSGFWDNFLQGTSNFLNHDVTKGVLNTLDAPRNAIFTQANNWMDGEFSWNDFMTPASLGQGMVNSFLDGGKVTTDTFLNQAGWEDKHDWSLGDIAHDTITIAGDVIGDPLTYATFGAGSAIKQAGTVGAKAALEAGLEKGTQAFMDFANKTGQAAAKRQAVGINIPFGPEFTLLEKSGPLKINSQIVGKQPAAELARKIEDLGIIGPQRYEFASKVVGRPIQTFNDLNTQEWDYLNQLANSKQFKTKVQEIMSYGPDPFASDIVQKPPARILSEDEAADINRRAGLDNGYVPNMVEQVETVTQNALQGGKIVRPTSPMQFTDAGRQAEQQLLQLYKYADEVGLPPGREREALDELWTHIAPPGAGTLDELVEAASKQGSLRVGRTAQEKMAQYGISPFRTEQVTQQVSRMVPESATPNFTFSEPRPGLPAVIPQSNDITETMLKLLGDDAAKGYTYFDGLDGMSDLGKLVKGSRVAEKIGRLFGGRRFVPVAEQLADHRIAQGVEGLEDARLGGYAKARFKVDDMAALANEPEIKNLAPEERLMLPYVIEGTWPKSINPNNIPVDSMQRMEAAATKLKLYRDQFTREELDAGVDYIPRENYFPHINNIPNDPAEFQAFLTQLEHINPDMATRIKGASKGFTRERKIFNTMSELRDFLDDNADNADIQKMFGGAVFDPVEAYAKRAMSGAQEVAKMQGYQVLKDLGIAKKAEPGKVKKGWKVVKMGREDYAVPAEIEQRINSLSRIMTNDAQLNKTVQKADDIYTIWRRNVTVVNPAFHPRQVIGNIFQNSLAGVTPKSYKMAAKVLHGKKDAPLLKYGRQELTGQGIMKMAMEDGVIGTGSSTDYLNSLTKELGNRLDKGKLLDKVNPLSEQFIPGRIGRKASEWEDNISRLAHYIHILQKGGSRKMARDSVIKHLFDYSNLSKFEKGMRVVFPFYNWMRNNIPFQIAQAVKRPGLYQIINDLQTSLQDTPDANELMDQLGINNPEDRAAVEQIVHDNGGVMPDYIRNAYINVGGNNFVNTGLPSNDLSSVNPTKIPDTVLQSLNPLFPWLSGLATNRTTFGTPIDMDNPSAARPSIPAGIGYTIQQFGGYPGRVATTLGGDLMDVMQGNEVNIGQDLAKLFLGVTQVDPVKKLEGLIYERARQITGR